jgi:hypothetical protein
MSWAASLITPVYESPHETSTKFSFRGLEANYRVALVVRVPGGACNVLGLALNREQTGWRLA